MSSKGKNRRENRDKAQKNIKAASKLRWRWADWIVFNATVFVAAGCIMSVEILSTRLVAPFLGSSLYTWTSAIGVVLAGISFGNYLGGRIADRFHPKRTLSLLFIISSVSCVTIPMVNSWMGTWAALDGLSWPTRIFLHFVFTFLLPATMLGTMSPVVAKMALNMGQSTGRTIGTIYAWGSIGSIVGTFVAGFFLVAWMGTERAIFAVAGVLAVVGILYGYRSWVPYAWSVAYTATMICAFVPWAWTQPIESLLGLSERNEESILFKKDSHYQRVVVKEVGTNLRKMVLDKLVHSQVNLADPLELKYNYEVIYSEVMRTSHPSNEPVTAMVMGGGGYVFPRYLEIMYPDSYVEVAEIDPVVTQAAFEAFGLPENTSIKYNNIDARNRIADLIRQKREGVKVPAFDFILGDSFSDFTVPYHLTTVEFNKLLYDLLSDDGIYMLNLIDMFSSGRFLGAVVNTCGKVFPHVAVFSTEALQSERNTFIVISSKLPLDVKGTLRSIQAKHPFRGSLLKPKHLDQLMKKNNHLVLTDDYAPVENLLAEVVQAYTKTTGKTESLVSKRLQDDIAVIESLFKKGDFDQVGARAQEALKFYPNATNIHFLLGSALARQGKLNQAIAEFRTELQVNPSHPQSRLSMARAYNLLGDKKAALKQYQLALNVDPKDPSIRCALAALLLESGNQEEAEKYYRLTIQDRPGYVKAYVGLGNLLSKKRNVAESISIWEQALRLNPAYPGLSHDLALSLFHARKYDKAIMQFRQALALEPESAVLHNELGRTLGISGNKAAAVDAFSQAVRREPQDASYRANLGLALEEVGRDEEAVFQYREVLKLHNKNLPVMNALAKLLSTSLNPTIRDGAEAVKLAERLCDLFGRNQPQALETLAAAYAEVGRFPEAVAAAQRAVAFAQKRKMENLANKIRKELALYEAGQPSRIIL